MHSLIDIGANLTHESFSRDLADIIERAAAVGVTRIIVTGSTPDSSEQAVLLARKYPARLYATAGIHPHHAQTRDTASMDRLAKLAHQPEAVAVGECGLDYYRDFSPRTDQRAAFEQQLAMAATAHKPVFLHQRDAHSDFLAILRDHIGALVGGVAHCFTGTRSEMEEYLDLGFYIGVTGWICDERRGDSLRAAVEALPLDRVMLETDAPYLLPRNITVKPASRRNEPACLPWVLETTAGCMGVSTGELAEASTVNAERLFGLSTSGGERIEDGSRRVVES